MQEAPLTFVDPNDPSRGVEWTGQSFLVAGKAERVLAYDVAQSGWTDDLTRLHEETGGSDHFIDIASRDYALSEVARCIPHEGATVLEVGCSSGFLLSDIRRRFPHCQLVGSDYTAGTLRALGARMSGIPLIQFDLTRCPLPDNFADIIVLLNVLEHIGDHEAAARHLFRIVRPGGAVIIEVPAGSSLYDVYDRVLMHERRYDMPGLVALMTNAGFSVERKSYLGALLYPAFYVSKRLNQIRFPEGKSVDEEKIVAGMIAATKKSSLLMGLAMNLEKMLRPYLPFPRGIRCLITCRKPA